MKSLMLLVAVAATPPETKYAWDCKVEERFQCVQGSGGCVPLEVTMSAYIYPNEGLYWRCPVDGEARDLGRCDRYEAAVSTSGAFRNIDLPERAALARVGPGLSFTEVVTLTDQVIVSYGLCQDAPPPVIWKKPSS